MERIVFMRVLRRTAILLPFLACFYGVFAQGAPEGAIIGDQGTNKLPSNLAYKHTFSQQIYTPQEVAAAMGYSTPTSCTIKSMVFSYKKTNAYDGAQRKWRIYLANVDALFMYEGAYHTYYRASGRSVRLVQDIND